VAEYEFQKSVDAAGLLCSRNFCSRSLKQLSIFNPGWTRGFACAATKTTIDMTFKGHRLNCQSSLFHRAHQVKTSAGTVVLVTGSDIGWAGFKTQPAVNASEKFVFFALESRRQR
jgi:hypothetical protein